MKVALPTSFLTAGKRALSSYLLAFRNGVEVHHDHSEPSAQIALAQLPVFGTDQTRLKDASFDERHLQPYNGEDSSGTLYTFTTTGVEVDPDLSLTFTSLPFAVVCMAVLKVELYNAAVVGGRNIITTIRLDGVANTMSTRVQAQRGFTHMDTFDIPSGTHTVTVQYVSSVTGATLEGNRRLTLSAWKGTIA